MQSTHVPPRCLSALMVAVLIGLARAAAAVEPPSGRTDAPNVVLIVSDDQHWSDYAFLGHPHLRTPSLDRLARESLVFTRGYVPSSLCCPSLASLITGRYPHEHGIVGNDPPENPAVKRGSPAGRAAFEAGRERMNAHLAEWPTLPQLLGRAGYRSLQTGKWWQGEFSRGGFDEGMTLGQRHGDEGLAIGRKTMQPVYDFIGRCREQKKPFFVWYAPMLPHDPHDPEAALVEHYSTKTDSVHVARYWGNVERFDRTVGELLDHLDRERLSADTLVVYVTDNGWIQNPAAPRFAPRSKLSPYDGGLRTPIMLRQPGRIEPGRSESLASSLDILPTVLAACGVDAPEGLPGVNLLDGRAVAERRQVFGECYTHTLVDLDDPARSLLWRWTVRDRFKLIVPATASAEAGAFPAFEGRLVDPDSRAGYVSGRVELYDVVADPAETNDLAATRPEIVRDLRASLDAWWDPSDPAPRPGRPEKPKDAAARSPNLLVFLADDLGVHDLGCTGSTFYRTPALDRLAADGMLFERGYAICPVCSPTRAGLVTGRHPARVRITNFIGGFRRGSLLPAEYLRSLPFEEVTIAERLQAEGYATGVFGKWHLGPPAEIPRHGFDAAEMTAVGPGGGPVDDPLHAKAIAAAAARFVSEHRDRPWFCYVPMHSVHVPLVTRPDLALEEGRRAVGVPPRFDPPPQHAGDPFTRGVQDHPVYSGMVREMDETVATVLAALEETGQAGETLVVFTSDNGGLATAEGAATSNLPERAGKGFVYEGGVRVPLIVRWPGIVKPGSRCATPVTTLDIAATLVDVSGSPADDAAPLDGTSLRPLLEGAATLPPRDLVWHYPHYSNQGGRPAAALLAGDGGSPGTEKLVLHYEGDRVELFNLASDPGEYRDLAADRPERTAELLGRLRSRLAGMEALMPLANPEPIDPFGPDANPRPPRRRP
jgi:arylsulfatase A-like enzyme